jgi:hypothetical protein
MHPEDRPSQHESESEEPLGPMTPDEDTAVGDTPEAHDEVSPHDLPKDHPGRRAVEEKTGDHGDLTGSGN